MLWFTSDHHFSDEGARIHRTRPFSSVHKMNEAMVKYWNEIVTPEDVVFHLGDFATTDKAVEEFAPQLNGKIRLILGNHDLNRPRKLLDKYFEVFENPLKYKFNFGKDELLLCHYPKQRPNPKTSNIYCVTGHVHDLWKITRKMVNVGVDVWHFRPISLDQVLSCREAEINGCWDANVYPDAPLDWQWQVSNIQKRSSSEPTLKILEKEIKEGE